MTKNSSNSFHMPSPCIRSQSQASVRQVESEQTGSHRFRPSVGSSRQRTLFLPAAPVLQRLKQASQRDHITTYHLPSSLPPHTNSHTHPLAPARHTDTASIKPIPPASTTPQPPSHRPRCTITFTPPPITPTSINFTTNLTTCLPRASIASSLSPAMASRS